MEKTFRENLFAFIYFLRHFCNIPKKKTLSIFSPFDRLNRTLHLALNRHATIYADIKLSISVGKSNGLKN